MILKVFITDAEITGFFEGCGHTCKMAGSGYWAPAYHNRSEWVETERLEVVAGGETVPAERLLEQTIKERLLNATLSPSAAIKKAIKYLQYENKT